MTLGLGDGGYARPVEILGLAFGNENTPALAFRLHRAAVHRIDNAGVMMDPMEL